MDGAWLLRGQDSGMLLAVLVCACPIGRVGGRRGCGRADARIGARAVLTLWRIPTLRGIVISGRCTTSQLRRQRFHDGVPDALPRTLARTASVARRSPSRGRRVSRGGGIAAKRCGEGRPDGRLLLGAVALRSRHMHLLAVAPAGCGANVVLLIGPRIFSTYYVPCSAIHASCRGDAGHGLAFLLWLDVLVARRTPSSDGERTVRAPR